MTRREQPHRFLDASLAPLEQALLARAQFLEDTARIDHPDLWLAEQFRKLAEELHHW